MTQIARTFGLGEHQINVHTEVFAGLTTFLMMAYITFVSPNILADAGMPHDAVLVVTCTATAIDTIIMRIYTNRPIAMTPGMGLNTYFVYVIVKDMDFTRQAVLDMVFIPGCLFLLVGVFRIHEIIVNGIPRSIRMAIAADIKLFLGAMSPRGIRLIVRNLATLVTLDDIHQPSVILAVVGFLAVVALGHLCVRSAILIDILAVTVASFFLADNTFHDVVSMLLSLTPTLLQLDIMSALSVGILNVMPVFSLTRLSDATNTLMGVTNRAGPLKRGKMNRLNKALLTDSMTIVAGSLSDTSSTTAYIENVSGVQAGGQTELATLTVVVLFLLYLFFSPLAGVVPAYATAPTLLYVSCLMLCELVDLSWEDTTEAVSAMLAVLVMLFTCLTTSGVAFDFITYSGLKLFTGRVREVPVIVWIISAVFLFCLFYLPGGH